MKNYSIIIKELRQETSLTQTKLAKLINVSQKVISNWEHGINEPTASNIIAICKYFDISADYLLGLKDY